MYRFTFEVHPDPNQPKRTIDRVLFWAKVLTICGLLAYVLTEVLKLSAAIHGH